MSTPWTDLKLGIAVNDEAITRIDFLPGNVEEIAASSGLAAAAVRHLRNYFRDPRHAFDLPLAPPGTPFQQRIWSALQRIPPGTTRRYGELARQMGSSARAVGGACRANPIPLIIPCHRVVAAQGMGGFMGVTAGRGLHIKHLLLAHESTS
jgi:methylated-DNA-[protein]-cysteine S-methyltransferase